jgi:phenylalanyl-tRNA synthetase beta chain
MRRDVAWIVGDAVPWSAVRAAVDAAAPPELCDVRFFDLFRGAQVGAGRKSLAFTLVFRSEDRTLTGDEVDAWEGAIVASLAERTGGTRRE